MKLMEFEEASALAEKWNAQLPKRIARFARYRPVADWRGSSRKYLVSLYTELTTISALNAYCAYFSVFCREKTGHRAIGWK